MGRVAGARAVTARPPLAALGLAAALAACGGDAAPKAPAAGPLRVEVIYAAVDEGGPVDGFTLVGEDGKTWPLASQPALDRAVLAADAPGGRYRVRGPAGWAPVEPVDALPLRGDLPPNPLWVGRTHTVYLVHPPELPATQVDARREDRETGSRPYEVRLESGTDGRSAVRLPADAGAGPLLLQVRLGTTHFAKPFRVQLRADGTPFHASAEPALVTTYDVLALPPDGRPAAGIEVAGVSRVAGLEARAVGTTNAGGWVRLEPVPVNAEGFRLEAKAPGGSPAPWPADALRLLGEARLLLPDPRPPAERGTLLVTWGSRDPDLRVQVRADGSDTYAVVTGEWETNMLQGEAYVVPLPPGRWWWIAEGRDVAASAEKAVETTAGGRTVAEGLKARPSALATLSVRIRGGFETNEVRYDLHARRIEDGKEVAVVGGTRRGLLRRDVDLALPAGAWRVRLALGAKESASKDVDLSVPGTRAALDLDAPR